MKIYERNFLSVQMAEFPSRNMIYRISMSDNKSDIQIPDIAQKQK